MRAVFGAIVLVGVVLSGCVPRPLETGASAPAPASAPEVNLSANATSAPTNVVADDRRVRRRQPTPRPVATLPSIATPRPIATPEPAPAAPLLLLDGLVDSILPLATTDYALVLEDLAGGAHLTINDHDVFPSASLYKLGVAWVVLRRVDAGLLSLDDPLVIEAEDTVEAEPAGGLAEGDAPTVREALGVMLSVSSNAAAHAFLRVIGRPEFNQEMDHLGLSQTRVPEGAAAEADNGEALAVTSAADIARLLRLIATGQLLNSGSKAELEQSLASITPPDALRDALPPGIDIYEKTGNLDDASNVGALLQSSQATVILVVLNHGVNPGDARAVIARLGQLAYDTLLRPPD